MSYILCKALYASWPPPSYSASIIYSVCSALEFSDDVYLGRVVYFEQKKIDSIPNYEKKIENLKKMSLFSNEVIEKISNDSRNNSFYRRFLTVKMIKKYDKSRGQWLWLNKEDQTFSFQDTVESGTTLWNDYTPLASEVLLSEYKGEILDSNKLFFIKKGKLISISENTLDSSYSKKIDCKYITDILRKQIYTVYDMGQSIEFEERVKKDIFYHPIQMMDYNFTKPVNLGCLTTTNMVFLGVIYKQKQSEFSEQSNDCFWTDLFSDSLNNYFKGIKSYKEYNMTYDINVSYVLNFPFFNALGWYESKKEKTPLEWHKPDKDEKTIQLKSVAAVGDASCTFTVFPFRSEIKNLNDGNMRLFYVEKSKNGSYELVHYSDPVVLDDVLNDDDPIGCNALKELQNNFVIPYINNRDAPSLSFLPRPPRFMLPHSLFENEKSEKDIP
ncbi:MAG: hypothetical protein LBR60_04025 [Fibrobacter sp.]|nr:hypothetical protein [Fibrobacter sp.]